MSPVRPGRGPSDILFIEDIRFYGHHGVTPAQQDVGAWFSVDVELTLDLTPAALSDDLNAGVDYGQVVQRVVAVGTTVVRALESAATWEGRILPARDWTRLRIRPERPPRAVDALITGLHEPMASHFDLLRAFVPEALLRRAYAEAVERGYLWHEFGDSALII